MNKILTEDDFDKKYTYDSNYNWDNQEGQEGMMETFSPHIEKVLELANGDQTKRVWTMIDGDEGMYLIAGYHLVNRIYYIITNEEWENEDEEYLIEVYEEETEEAV